MLHIESWFWAMGELGAEFNNEHDDSFGDTHRGLK